ncbi:MAG: hypothetical protein Q7T07_04790 [Burkholderiaceae bacterium]|nr:hypothetical protein [Burkholderiaceae bacterium]
MRILSYLTTFLVAVLLAACGGGGGSPGLSSGSVTAFSVVAPSTLTLQVGSLQQYAIKGGVKPYSVFSTDPAVAVGWIGGDDSVSIGTVVAGKASITVLDAKGSKFDIAVTSGSSTAFFTTAAATLTLSPGVAQAQTYTLGGGTGPYTATSNFPTVATVKVDGNRMTITGVQIDLTNSATITMRDAAGATLTSVVSVKTTEFKLTPGSADTATIYLGDTMNLVITGGTPPYRIIEPIGGVFDASIINGNQVLMIGNRIAEGVQINIVDADNQSASGPKVKIVSGQDSLRISPSAFTLLENANSPNIVLNVFGVAVGSTLQVFTSDNTVLVPGTPVKANTSGSAYTITLAGGNTCSLAVVPGSAAVQPVDNTVPKDGDFTDTVIVPVTQPVADQPFIPAVLATGGDRVITITVIDSSGRQGSSTITVKDTNLKAGC